MSESKAVSNLGDKKNMSTARKIFNYEDMSESKVVSSLGDKKNLYTYSISACGCLFYRRVKGSIQLLLISYADPGWPRLDDFGGRVDESDESIADAISRETEEETNKVIDSNFMQDLLSDNSNYLDFYNKESKYYVVLIEVDESFHPDTKVFGDFENCDKISRTIDWHDYLTVKPKLAMRLLCNLDLIEHLNSLANQTNQTNQSN